MIKSAIVTGGTGVTGNALIRYLLGMKVKVTALVRPDSPREKYLPKDDPLLRLVSCGLDGYADIDFLLKRGKYDVFFHLAWDGSRWKDKEASRRAFHLQNQNVGYSLDAVELCHRLECPVFVMTGSQAEYGRHNYPIAETEEKHPENGYGMAKLCAEGMTRLLCREYEIRHVWPILFSVYGPYDGTESLIDTTIRGLLQGERRRFTEGIQKWDYLYSYDAARALSMLAEKGRDGEAYHVASGISISIEEYVRQLYEVVSPSEKPRLGELKYSDNSVMFLGADIHKIKEELGFEPEYDFKSGIHQIVETILLEMGDAKE